MLEMTGRTSQNRVITPMFPELDDLFVMTGETRQCHVFCQPEHQGRVRIIMAAGAAAQLEMAFPGMAVRAFGDRPPTVGRVAPVTIGAGYFGLMGQTFGFNILDGFHMAFSAIFTGQSFPRFISGLAGFRRAPGGSFYARFTNPSSRRCGILLFRGTNRCD